MHFVQTFDAIKFLSHFTTDIVTFLASEIQQVLGEFFSVRHVNHLVDVDLQTSSFWYFIYISRLEGSVG